MAQPLLAPPPASDPWAAEFQPDTTPAPTDPWAQEFTPDPQPATPSDPWASEFTPAEDPWAAEFSAASQQSPLETGLRTIGQDLGSLYMTGVSGLGRYFENLSGVANQVVPGLGDVLDYAPQSALFQALAPVADDLRQETQTIYKPDAERNPIAATVGGGLAQAFGMVPMIATGGTPLVLGAAAASGYGQGSQTAEDLGVQNPAGQMALGVGFGAAETLVERLGGIGAGPVKAGAQQIVESLGKSTLKTIGSETLEEPVTGGLQDAASLVAASTVTDPTRPGYTITGQPIAPLLPNSPEYWKSRGMEALGGAAGGTVFAGLGALANRAQSNTPSPTVEGDLPGTPPPPAAPTITLNGQPYTYNPNELTPDALQTIAATGNLQDYLDAGMLQNATPQTPPPLPGTPPPLNVAPPPPPVVDTPGPSIQEARETLGDLGNVGTRAAPATTVGRAGPAPLPRDPDGNLDLLNYLNDNPIRAPRRGTEGSAAAEYEWRESGDFDPAYRARIMQEGAPNIDQRAQEAYDLGYIPAPTAEALAAEVRNVIAKRQQQRRQGPGQAKILNEQERAQVQFEQTQTRLATTGQPVNLDDLAPGDTLRIDGQPITVADIDYDEDGYTTRALLRTPTGTVRVTPETNLRADRPTSSAPLDLEDLNAQLALAAEANTGFTNTTIVATRQDGSTILYPELVALAARALTAGTRFTTWAANLVKQFGQSIKQYLAGAWQAARKTSRQGFLAGPGAILGDERRRALTTAQSMAAAGKSTEEIRALTGWFPGKYDGKLRWEGNDAEARIRPRYQPFELAQAQKAQAVIDKLNSAGSFEMTPEREDAIEQLNAFRANANISITGREAARGFAKLLKEGDETDIVIANFRGGKLGDILHHPQLFEAYPEAKNIFVVPGGTEKLGSFNASTNTIEVNWQSSPETTVSTILHELQHWIQAKEDFARGSSTEQASLYRARTKALDNMLIERERELFNGKTALEMDNEAFASDNVLERINQIEATLNADPEYTQIKEEWEARKRTGFKETFEVYQSAAGEIEARDVQARQTFTPEQRAATAPYSSENIAPEDAIVMFGSSGPQMSLDPTQTTISARPPTMAEAISGQTRESQFGQRVQADERLTDPLRAAPVSTFAVQGQQQALDQANALIRDIGLEGATAQFTNDASLPMPVRIIGLMQAALQYDARAALAQRRGNEAGSAAADAATAAAIDAKATLEIFGNESGRNLAAFNTWARMSPDGQLRRLERGLTNTARQTVRGDQGVTPQEVTDLVIEETASPAIDEMIDQIIIEGAAITPVNLQTGAPIAARTAIDVFLGGIETVARAVSESSTIQTAVAALDRFMKALNGKLFSDPFLLTPAAQAILKTTRALLLQGTKLSQAIADAIAVVRTKIPIPATDVAPLTQAVTAAVVKEVIRPILRKLAFDPAYNKREATKDMLAIGIGVMEAGRLADAVIAKRPKIAKAAQDIVRQRVMRRLSDKPRAKSRKQKLPAILDTLVLAAGAGFINERTFLNAWDKKHPLPKLTPADRQRLRQMAAAVNLLPEGVLRQAEAIKFLNQVALIEGIPATDVILGAWYANLLAGLSTQGVNVWGNGLHLFFRTVASGIGSPADLGKLLKGLAAGVRPGLREAKEVLKTGTLLKILKRDDMQASAALEQLVAQGKPRNASQWLAYVMSLGGLTRYVFRAMGAMDAVFWYSAQEGHANLAVSRSLRKAGGLKPGTPAFNAEFIRQLGGDETQWLADLDQARTELQAAGIPVTPSAVNRRAWELRQTRRSQEVQDASVRWADRMVFQQQPEGIGRMITGMITLLQNFRPAGVPVFVPLVPFNRILSNLFESSLDWAGVGIVRGLVGSHLSEVFNKDRRMFDTAERRERFMAGIMGASIAGALLAAAMALKDLDDEEVPFMLYGMGPPDPTRRGLMPKGWRPFSMKINGTYVSFAESPMGPLLGAVGAWLDSARYSKTENKTLVERGTIAFQSALSSFMSMGVLSSMKDIIDLWTGEGNTRAIKQAALSPVPGFIPAQGLLRDMAPLFDDRKISDADIFGALVKDIPVLKSYGRPALNVLGEEVKIEGLPVVRRFATGQRPDANIAFIQQHKLKITALDKTIDIGDYLPKRERTALGLEDSDRRRALGMTAIENGVMTPAQQYQFTKAQGEAIKGGLERLRKSMATIPPSPQATDAFQKQLNAITEAARITAMRQLVSELR